MAKFPLSAKHIGVFQNKFAKSVQICEKLITFSENLVKFPKICSKIPKIRKVQKFGSKWSRSVKLSKFDKNGPVR